jgi:hypothetical protein
VGPQQLSEATHDHEQTNPANALVEPHQCREHDHLAWFVRNDGGNSNSCSRSHPIKFCAIPEAS